MMTETPLHGVRLLLARMPTGLKMLLILTAALLPLGLIALFASIQSAHTKRLQHEADARLVATAEARQVDLLLLRGANAVRTGIAMGGDRPERCPQIADATANAFHQNIRVAFFDRNGRRVCATPGFTARRLPPPRGRIGVDVLLLEDTQSLRFTAATPDGAYGVGEFPASLLRRVMPVGDSDHIIVLTQGATKLRLLEPQHAYPVGNHLVVGAPISGGQINLSLTVMATRISAVEILLVLLPVLMWAAAAVIGWIVVNQLLLRPLAQLQASVDAYGPGRAFSLPRLTTPSREIRELGEAFRRSSEQLAQREAALEEGLSHQVRLTREVHHRVKNNLQVVASLINLHSRGTKGEVADAYASIQRRVDALAVVHRNHFAELEENRGIALRSLAAELAANLRGTAPAAASHMTITLSMAPAFISQDVAVPVAFLITELVELVMTCDPAGAISIGLEPGETEGRATLSIAAPGLVEERCANHPMLFQFERVLLGLSRQLRSPLVHDEQAGRYSISIAVLPASS